MSEAKPKPKVLVVESYEFTREAIAEFLEPRFEVISVPNALACLHALEQHADISVLTTSSLRTDPMMNGFSLAKLVRNGFPQMKIILVTGGSPEFVAMHSGSFYFDGIVYKPFMSRLGAVMDWIFPPC